MVILASICPIVLMSRDGPSSSINYELCKSGLTGQGLERPTFQRSTDLLTASSRKQLYDMPTGKMQLQMMSGLRWALIYNRELIIIPLQKNLRNKVCIILTVRNET